MAAAVACTLLPAQAADFSWTSGAYLAQGLPNPLLAGDRVIATGAATKTFVGVIANQGTISWQTSAAATLSGGGTVLSNAGLFELVADAAIIWNASQGVVFENSGLLLKSGGDGTSAVTARMVNRTGGVLQADSGSIAYRGNVNLFEAGTVFAGSGTHRLDWSSEYNFADLLINTAAELNLAAGRFVSQGQGVTAVRGAVIWSGGEFQGNWQLEAPSQLAVGSGPAKSVAGSFDNRGHVQWATSNALVLSGGGTVWRNAGSFDLRADASILWNASQGVVFENSGLLLKSGGDGTSAVTARMVNRTGGVLQADSGSIAYRGNVNLFEAGTVFAGSGIHRLDWSSEYNFADLLINTAAELNLAAGRFVSQGQGVTAVRGAVIWSGGEFQGNWQLEAPSQLAVGSGPAKSVAGSFDNRGHVQWATRNALVLSGGGTVWRNAGSFDLRDDAAILWNANQGAVFENTGLLRKSGGEGTSAITTRLSNTGTIEVTSGTLSLPTGFFNEGLLRGTASFAAGLLDNRAVISPGLPGAEDRIATLTLAGALWQSGNAVLQVDIGPLGLSDLLSISGSAHLDGSVHVTGLPGYQPQVGDTFRIATFASLTGQLLEIVAPSLGPDVIFEPVYGATFLDLRVSAVPEPSAAWLLLAGMGLLAARRSSRPQPW